MVILLDSSINVTDGLLATAITDKFLEFTKEHFVTVVIRLTLFMFTKTDKIRLWYCCMQ